MSTAQRSYRRQSSWSNGRLDQGIVVSRWVLTHLQHTGTDRQNWDWMGDQFPASRQNVWHPLNSGGWPSTLAGVPNDVVSARRGRMLVQPCTRTGYFSNPSGQPSSVRVFTSLIELQSWSLDCFAPLDYINPSLSCFRTLFTHWELSRFTKRWERK